jgi:hypothetical protein
LKISKSFSLLFRSIAKTFPIKNIFFIFFIFSLRSKKTLKLKQKKKSKMAAATNSSINELLSISSRLGQHTEKTSNQPPHLLNALPEISLPSAIYRPKATSLPPPSIQLVGNQDKRLPNEPVLSQSVHPQPSMPQSSSSSSSQCDVEKRISRQAIRDMHGRFSSEVSKTGSGKRQMESSPSEEPIAKRNETAPCGPEDEMSSFFNQIMESIDHGKAYETYVEIEKKWNPVRDHILKIMYEYVSKSVLEMRSVCRLFDSMHSMGPLLFSSFAMSHGINGKICQWIPEDKDQQKILKDKMSSDNQIGNMSKDLIDDLLKDWKVISDIYKNCFDRPIEEQVKTDFKDLISILSFCYRKISK